MPPIHLTFAATTAALASNLLHVSSLLQQPLPTTNPSPANRLATMPASTAAQLPPKEEQSATKKFRSKKEVVVEGHRRWEKRKKQICGPSSLMHRKYRSRI